jgi:hypothetical protein
MGLAPSVLSHHLIVHLEMLDDFPADPDTDEDPIPDETEEEENVEEELYESLFPDDPDSEEGYP